MSVSTSHRQAETQVWADLGAFLTPERGILGGLVVIAVLLVMTGRLVPVTTLTRHLEQANQRAEDLRAARDAADARADRLADYLHQLMPYARVTGELVTEMRRAVEAAPAQAMDGRDPS